MSAPVIQENAPGTKRAESARANRPVAGRERHRVRLAVAEMNYASRRLVELQAPWAFSERRHSK
jgi:hypothetical protein